MVHLVATPLLSPPFTAVPHEYYQASAAQERHDPDLTPEFHPQTISNKAEQPAL